VSALQQLHERNDRVHSGAARGGARQVERLKPFRVYCCIGVFRTVSMGDMDKWPMGWILPGNRFSTVDNGSISNVMFSSLEWLFLFFLLVKFA
jgi:hypothetical protein